MPLEDKTISLNITDLERINKVCSKFNVKYFKLIQQSESGIGYILTLEFPFQLNDEMISARIVISDEKDW
jgi:hypothetical protein